MKSRTTRLGLLMLAALAVVGLGFFGADPAHALGFDWHGAALGGMILANAPIAIPEQIKLFEAKRTAAKDAAETIVAKSIEEGRTLDEHETEQHRTLEAELKAIDDHIALLKRHELVMIEKARPVTPGTDAPAGANVDRGGYQPVTVKSNLPPGIAWTRMALAMAVAKGNVMHAHEIAKVRFKDTPQVVNALQAAVHLGGTRDLNEKAAVAFGTGTDASFAGPLVQYHDMETEFVGLLRPMTILGKMDRVRRVPFMMRVARQLTGVSGSFVGEGAPKPVGKQTYDNATLNYAKAAVIVVLTDELVRFSSPNAETTARDDMLAGIATYLDRRFIDPSFAGVPNISPASITNNATRIQSSGNTLAAIDHDVQQAMAMFTSSDVDPSTAVWVMPPTIALRLSMKRTTQDGYAYPDIKMNGGTWYGLPVIASNAMTTSGSPGELQIALVTQNEVFLADDGGISIDMSMEASVQMNDTPSAGAQSLVSLWQNNLIGLRAERYINWAPRRQNSLGIALIENVAY